MFDPDAHMPRINRGMVYLGACLIAGIRLAREKQVNAANDATCDRVGCPRLYRAGEDLATLKRRRSPKSYQ